MRAPFCGRWECEAGRVAVAGCVLGRRGGEVGEHLDRTELRLPAVLLELLEEQREHTVDSVRGEGLHLCGGWREKRAGGV